MDIDIIARDTCTASDQEFLAKIEQYLMTYLMSCVKNSLELHKKLAENDRTQKQLKTHFLDFL